MIQVRKSEARGHANHGWLKSHHTFSFADYFDPAHMGFRSLRVINEDYIAGGTGFDSHPHRDMEIITYVVTGILEHKDSMGNTALIRPGEVQRMSAGTGVIHSEFNASKQIETHLFQIWIQPDSFGEKPSYEQKSFEEDFNKNKMTLVVSKDGRDGSIKIKQDAELSVSKLKSNDHVEYKLRPGRGAWVQVISGELEVNKKKIHKSDGLAIEDEPVLKFEALENCEFLLFDLA